MKELLVIALIFIVILGGSFGVGVFEAHKEAAVFNKFKSENQPEATWVDAFFSDLRVITE